MQSTEINKPQSVRIFVTHTKENFDYYSKRFKDLTNVKVVYEKMTPKEKLEKILNELMGCGLEKIDTYRQ